MIKTFIILINMLLYVSCAHANSIGTLFYSPAERAALVAARNGIAQTAAYTVNGIIQREQKKSAVWINGRAIPQMPPDPAIPTLVIHRDHVLIEEKPIKVGETLNIISGQRVLRLPENAVQVKP
ncbi:MAG: hypothetical protein NTY60_03790 [Proteobacteria bacterium]|nr:hypothetical protein [Pseudomonadota bacterium]